MGSSERERGERETCYQFNTKHLRASTTTTTASVVQQPQSRTDSRAVRMMDTSSVPLMMDVEGGGGEENIDNMGAALSTGLMVLILGGFLQIFMGNEMTDTAMAIGGALLFSLFIIYDTQMIMTRLSAEEYILATIQLYLDIINLFIEILKILEKINRK